MKDPFSHFTDLTAVSYNCRGNKNSTPDVQKLCNVYDIIFLQETWLTKQNLDYLSSISDDHYAYGYTPIDDYDSFRKERPFGGTAVLWRKNLPATQITSHSGSIIGLKLDNDAGQILLLNVYLPYCFLENFDAYQTHLGELSSFCDINAALEIFTLGDFNAGKSNQFWKILMDFCEDNNFIISDDRLLPDISFTYSTGKN